MSGTKNLRPLVITTRSVQTAGSEYVWNKLQAPEVFIGDIVTQEVNAESSEELSKLVSGIPTPFARAAMFKYAISYVGRAEDEASGLLAFYKTLQDEWKGLLACFALDNQPLSVDKIRLQYSYGKGVEDAANIYEPKGALGTMLFEDRDLWSDQQEHLDATRRAAPFVYVIRYNGVVVGATAPEALLFTAPVYHLNTRNAFYSQVTKKFTDPLKANLAREDVEKLYVYVKHVATSLEAYRAQFTKRKPDVLKLSVFLDGWLADIAAYADRKGYQIDRNAIVPNLDKFQSPFSTLFNYRTTLYGYGGRISSDLATLHLPDDVRPIEVDLAELLLNPATATVAEVIFDEPADASQAGVHLLRAPSDRGDRYFTLPLSEKGLAIFQDEIGGLLQLGGEVKSYLSAVYDLPTRTLRVTLQADVNGTTTSFTQNYREPARLDGQRVICWPDFISTIWCKYYLYSELPHNGPEIKAFPLRADARTFRLLAEDDGAEYRFRKIALNGKKARSDDTAELLVEYDLNKLGSTDLKYEIYESADPFKGVELWFQAKPAGYVVFRSVTSGHPSTLKDYRLLMTTLNPVRVGFDFGSNNTCISHATAGAAPELITFKNRRKCLLGVDARSNERVAASPSEVFFFQNEVTLSNRIKSMVMIHDERRVRGMETDPTIVLQREVKGGFPVFEANIPVEDSTESTYTVRFASQPSYIKFNMKWSNDEKENAYKQGLLKALWLGSYAELLEQGKYPESLVWAYPSAMNKQVLLKYGILWNQVGQVNPLQAPANVGFEYQSAKVAQFAGARPAAAALGGGFGGGFAGGFAGGRPTGFSASGTATAPEFRAQTEAASVCKHALGVGFQTGRNGLIIGFDIGGSTTDILCIALKKDRASASADDFRDTLIKEGSIRFAAGRLADATKRSKRFQDVLRSFCRKKELYIHGITVMPDRLNASTSSYYYNLLVDHLDSEADLSEFYRNLAADCPDLFTVNAYMTGLIMFYAGQLARKIRHVQDENPSDYLAPFDDVMVGCFGKGGRMFDWLRAVNEQAAFGYFQSCFGAGYGHRAADHIKGFTIKPSDPSFVKAEVSFGLSRYNDIHTTPDPITELIGEEGFTYNGANVEEHAPVEPRFLQHFGNQFSTPREFRRFSEYASIFGRFCKEYFGFELPAMQQEITGMRLKSYVQNIPEYQLAQRGQEFDFEAPIIILEGMCFLDTVLMPKLFR